MRKIKREKKQLWKRKTPQIQEVSSPLQASPPHSPHIDMDEGVLQDDELMAEDLTPQVARLPRSQQEKEEWKRVIVVLEQANLELTKTKNGLELINSDDHHGVIKKAGKSYEEYRPDITHQCLLALLDSPLNKAGMLQIFIHTANGVLIQISPKTRIPRTYKRFAGVMAQCLKKFRIRAAKTSDTLMRVVKNPVTEHFPTNIKKISLSSEGKLVNLHKYVRRQKINKSAVFVIGAVSIGNPSKNQVNILAQEIDYQDELIAISNYSLSAANCCGKLTDAFQNWWGVL